MPSRRRVAVLVALLQLAVIAGAHAATPVVPFVGCPSDGQGGPVAPPSGKAVAVDAPPNVAAQLAFYKGANGRGVFAPKGWRCREWYGSNGWSVVVTPSGPPASIPANPLPAQGVQLTFRDGGTSGRFDVAEVSARFFPDLMRDFIQQVRAEGFEPESKFTPVPYPKDNATRISERMIAFGTPPRQAGFGTSGLLTPWSEPILGIVALTPASEEIGMTTLFIRVRADQFQLSTAIIGIEARCLQTLDGCVPSLTD